MQYKYSSMNHKMKGYLNILECDEKIHLSLTNIPIIGDISKSRLVRVTKESLKDISKAQKVDEQNEFRLFLSTFGENGFSLSLLPIEAYIILETHDIENIFKSIQSLRRCRLNDEPLKRGKLLDLIIEDIKNPTMETTLDIITYLLRDALGEKQNKIFDLFCTFKDTIVSLEDQCKQGNVNETMIVTNVLLKAISENRDLPEKLRTSLLDTCVTIMNLLEQIVSVI